MLPPRCRNDLIRHWGQITKKKKNLKGDENSSRLLQAERAEPACTAPERQRQQQARPAPCVLGLHPGGGGGGCPPTPPQPGAALPTSSWREGNALCFALLCSPSRTAPPRLPPSLCPFAHLICPLTPESSRMQVQLGWMLQIRLHLSGYK